jgi:Ni/Co efflux regulator RcnB
MKFRREDGADDYRRFLLAAHPRRVPWIRIGEALFGLVLIAVGTARITRALPVATSIARTVGAAGLAGA